jgi:molecular chaperone HscB
MQAGLEKNHFELFGLPSRFDIDRADLDQRYRDLQRHFHPDRYASGSDQQRRLALQMTAHINEAYQALKDPLARGRYILGLHGVSTDEETDTVMDPVFLMEQMELRESMQEARTAPDRLERLPLLLRDVERRLTRGTEELGRRLDEKSTASLARARSLVREMQFLRKVQREIEELEQSE